MVEIPINPQVLVWARKERGLSEAEAAKRLGISEEELRQVEASEKLPISKLRRIASKFQITFASLLMPEPLPDNTRPKVTDFRTHESGKPRRDHELLVRVEDINQQLELMGDIRRRAPELFGQPIFPLATLGSNEERLAARERERISVPLTQQFAWQTDSTAFKHWRNVIEAQGVFVYVINLGPTKNCRGLSFFDERNIPVVVVNSTESEAKARNFTLWHEYAHILLRMTGISDQNRRNAVERFCNQFAAFFLMPRADFKTAAERLRSSSGELGDYQVARLATQFKVSKTAAAIHLEDIGLVPSGFYARLSAKWSKPKEKKAFSQATHPEKKLTKYGVKHVRTVFEALDRGRINQLDAHDLLDVQPKDFKALREEAEARLEAYGGAG